MSYFDIYRKRLNRYGIDYQSRIQNQREKEFDNYLLKTIYWVSFDYAGKECIASLEPDKQDETQVLQYLLTKRDLEIPGGTILTLTNKDNLKSYWMIYLWMPLLTRQRTHRCCRRFWRRKDWLRMRNLRWQAKWEKNNRKTNRKTNKED